MKSASGGTAKAVVEGTRGTLAIIGEYRKIQGYLRQNRSDVITIYRYARAVPSRKAKASISGKENGSCRSLGMRAKASVVPARLLALGTEPKPAARAAWPPGVCVHWKSVWRSRRTHLVSPHSLPPAREGLRARCRIAGAGSGVAALIIGPCRRTVIGQSHRQKFPVASHLIATCAPARSGRSRWGWCILIPGKGRQRQVRCWRLGA